MRKRFSVIDSESNSKGAAAAAAVALFNLFEAFTECVCVLFLPVKGYIIEAMEIDATKIANKPIE